jgi:hypothetical protein
MSAEMIQALRLEAERIEEDAEYTHKSHYNAAETWRSRQYWLGIPAAILAALASALIFFDGSPLAQEWEQYYSWFNATAFAAGAALTATLLSTLLTFLNPAERSERHKAAGGYYLSLRNRARVYRTVDLAETANPERLRERLEALSETRNHLNETSPKPPGAAFRKAQKGIEDGESTHRVDKEVS